jgi:hypothetical protein
MNDGIVSVWCGAVERTVSERGEHWPASDPYRRPACLPAGHCVVVVVVVVVVVCVHACMRSD